MAHFRNVAFCLPLGWIVYPVPDPNGSLLAGPLPERDGWFRSGLILSFVPMTAPDVRAALLHLVSQIRSTRPGMTEPVASDFRLGKLPSDAIRIHWSGPNGELQEEIVAMESSDAGEPGFLFADAVFEVGDRQTRAALEDALRTFTIRAPDNAT